METRNDDYDKKKGDDQTEPNKATNNVQEVPAQTGSKNPWELNPPIWSKEPKSELPEEVSASPKVRVKVDSASKKIGRRSSSSSLEDVTKRVSELLISGDMQTKTDDQTKPKKVGSGLSQSSGSVFTPAPAVFDPKSEEDSRKGAYCIKVKNFTTTEQIMGLAILAFHTMTFLMPKAVDHLKITDISEKGTADEYEARYYILLLEEIIKPYIKTQIKDAIQAIIEGKKPNLNIKIPIALLADINLGYLGAHYQKFLTSFKLEDALAKFIEETTNSEIEAATERGFGKNIFNGLNFTAIVKKVLYSSDTNVLTQGRAILKENGCVEGVHYEIPPNKVIPTAKVNEFIRNPPEKNYTPKVMPEGTPEQTKSRPRLGSTG